VAEENGFEDAPGSRSGRGGRGVRGRGRGRGGDLEGRPARREFDRRDGTGRG
jgi:hypothetical protein